MDELGEKWQPVACEPRLFSAFAQSVLRVTKANHFFLHLFFSDVETCQLEM